MKDESLPLPPSDHGRSHDEIAAEIADHLTAAELELTKRGMFADEAHEAARKKFGDVEKIKQTCYWIQNGETIMLRWTLVSLAAVLCILLGLSVLGNWRTQSQLADEMGKLSSELKSLAAAKQAPPPVPQPPEIRGVIYAGSKDKPPAGANVAILRGDGTVVRRTTCDDKGNYHSGPLETGDYFVTSPLQNAPERYSKRVTQSEPVFLHGGSGMVTLDLDAGYQAGGLKFSVSRDLPNARKEGRYLISSRLNVFVARSRMREHPWTAKENSPNRWPIYCYPDFPLNREGSRSSRGIDLEGISPASSYFMLKPGEEREFRDQRRTDAAIFPPDDTGIEATLLISIVPLNERGDVVVPDWMYSQVRAYAPELNDNLTASQRAATKSRTIPATLLDEEGSFVWQFLSTGQPWLSKLMDFAQVGKGYVAPSYLPRESAVIKDGQFTRIVFDIPEGIEEEVQKVIESAPDGETFEKLTRDRFLRRPIPFRVVGYEPMEK